MKSLKLLSLTIALGVIAMLTGSAAEPTPVDKESAARSTEQREMDTLVLAKRFCVALRRGDTKNLRAMISPHFLSQHGLDRETDLPLVSAPVKGIYDIKVAEDGRTVLCLYRTNTGSREAMLLQTEWHENQPYISIANPPDTRTGKFHPWILRTELDGFTD